MLAAVKLSASVRRAFTAGANVSEEQAFGLPVRPHSLLRRRRVL